MEFIKPGINIDFVGKRKLFISISLLIIAIGIVSLIVKGGPKYGIDFAGGTIVQIKFKKNVTIGNLRKSMGKDVSVQTFGEAGDEFLLRFSQSSADTEALSKNITNILVKNFGKNSYEIRRIEMVGPKIGKDLRKKGLLAVIVALIGILIYVSVRFEFRFAVGAIIALVHDVLITLGLFSILNKEIDLTVLAAFLTIVGYSLNDTIIVYDRIRENMKKYVKGLFGNIINRSINETLSRTILTSGTTLFVVLALFVFGGGVIHDFALALLIGIVVGTYSSIYIASPILLLLDKKKKK
jgi:preprotein translocase subunit SecF